MTRAGTKPALPVDVVRLPLRTPTLPPATTTNTLVLGSDQVAIIEPGTPHLDEQERLDDVLEKMRAEGKRATVVLITHHHHDHTGYARPLADRLRVPLCAHAATAARLPFPVDRLLADGETIDLGNDYRIEAVHTPGHAPGHLVFIEHRTRVAHVGDMVAGEGTILIDPDDDGDMAAYLQSLERIGALDACTFIPAHGPVIVEPKRIVDHYLQHRRQRERKILDAIDAGGNTFDDILTRSYDDVPVATLPIAARSLRAHLCKLERTGEVVCRGIRILRSQ